MWANLALQCKIKKEQLNGVIVFFFFLLSSANDFVAKVVFNKIKKDYARKVGLSIK